jgi:hypothetical protein
VAPPPAQERAARRRAALSLILPLSSHARMAIRRFLL